jgi:hypothetical protein
VRPQKAPMRRVKGVTALPVIRFISFCVAWLATNSFGERKLRQQNCGAWLNLWLGPSDAQALPQLLPLERCVCVCSQSMFLPMRQAEVLWGLYVMFSPSFISEIHGNSVSGLLWRGLEESDQQAISWCARALWNRDVSWPHQPGPRDISTCLKATSHLAAAECPLQVPMEIQKWGQDGDISDIWRFVDHFFYHFFSMIFYVFPIRIATRLQ